MTGRGKPAPLRLRAGCLEPPAVEVTPVPAVTAEIGAPDGYLLLIC